MVRLWYCSSSGRYQATTSRASDHAGCSPSSTPASSNDPTTSARSGSKALAWIGNSAASASQNVTSRGASPANRRAVGVCKSGHRPSRRIEDVHIGPGGQPLREDMAGRVADHHHAQRCLACVHGGHRVGERIRGRRERTFVEQRRRGVPAAARLPRARQRTRGSHRSHRRTAGGARGSVGNGWGTRAGDTRVRRARPSPRPARREAPHRTGPCGSRRARGTRASGRGTARTTRARPRRPVPSSARGRRRSPARVRRGSGRRSGARSLRSRRARARELARVSSATSPTNATRASTPTRVTDRRRRTIRPSRPSTAQARSAPANSSHARVSVP